ncbi:MAG: type II secretion system protein GspH [Gammaproteobacteria bacterium]|nr:type II secretion system protein GspH [Gammaproteobacteria bacterium]
MPLLRPSLPRGFTLLEVMVVVVLVGILANMVRLAVGDGGRGAALRDTARVLQQLTRVAADEAMITSRPVALILGPEGYGLQRWQEGSWRRPGTDALYRVRRLPPGMDLRVTGSDDGAALGSRVPAIFFPDGNVEALGMELRLLPGERRARLLPEDDGYRVEFN